MSGAQRMFTRTKSIVLAASLLFGAAFTSAQAKRPAETRNAALRYWMAFAELQDPPTDKATAELLEKTAACEAPLDETKHSSLLYKNEDTVLCMLSATK